MADAPISIHAGAHRTGTSSFQMCLHENRQALDQMGWTLAYPGRDGIPSGDLALRLPSGHRVPAKAAAKKVADVLSGYRDGRPVILSEENILGRMFHFMQGQFYPFADERCAALRDGWSGPIAHVVLVVRPYASLYMSAFRKRAEDNEMPPFDKVRSAYLSMDRGWPELVSLMQDILQPQTFTVIPYTARGTSLDVLKRLVPDLPVADLVEPKRVVNQSATDAALQALQAQYRAGQSLSRADWKAVIDEYAHDTVSRQFAAFTETEVAHLAARFASDLKQIEWMPNVTLA